MGRKETPLDLAGGPLTELARDLRVLRSTSGDQTYRQMAGSTHYSPATLARAANGRALPSLDVTLAYVRACGGDVTAWRRRWQAVADRVAEAARQSSPARVTPARQGPSQLPRIPADFIGRYAELRLAERGVRSRERAQSLLVVTGQGGVGKTYFAIELAHRLAGEYPDGQLWLCLSGANGRRSVGHLLEQLLRSFDVATGALPDDPEDRAALYRSILAGRRCLLVLDDAQDASQVRLLLPPGPSLVIATSRARVLALDGGQPIALQPFTEEEAIKLLATVAGRDRVHAEVERAADVAHLCGRLPLALRIVGARLAARPNWTIAELASRLTAESGRLRELSAGDVTVRASLELSYRDLDESAAALFRRLGHLPGSSFGVDAAAALVAAPPSVTLATVELLVDANLVEPGPDVQRFQVHELSRLFAKDKANADCFDDRSAAMRRLLEWYVATASAAALVTDRLERLLPADLLDVTAAATSFAGRQDALAWLTAERVNLVQMARQAAAEGPPAAAWLIADTLRGFMFHHRYLDDWEAVAEAGLDAAQRTGDRRACAAMAVILGQARTARSQYPGAEQVFLQALTMARAAGWRAGEAVAQANLGCVRDLQGRLVEALACFEAAVSLNHELGNQRGVGIGLGNLASVQRRLGRTRVAIESYSAALEVHQRVGNQHSWALTLSNRANALLQLGRCGSALDDCRRAAAIWDELASPLGLALWHTTLSAIYLQMRRYAAAERCARIAVRAATDIGDQWIEVDAANQLAAVYLGRERIEDAFRQFSDGLNRARRIAATDGEVTALLGLAEAHARAERPEEGVDAAEQALRLTRSMGYRAAELRALTVLAELHLGRQDAEAAAAASQALAMVDVIHPVYRMRALLARSTAHRDQDPRRSRADHVEADRLCAELKPDGGAQED